MLQNVSLQRGWLHMSATCVVSALLIIIAVGCEESHSAPIASDSHPEAKPAKVPSHTILAVVMPGGHIAMLVDQGDSGQTEGAGNEQKVRDECGRIQRIQFDQMKKQEGNQAEAHADQFRPMPPRLIKFKSSEELYKAAGLRNTGRIIGESILYSGRTCGSFHAASDTGCVGTVRTVYNSYYTCTGGDGSCWDSYEVVGTTTIYESEDKCKNNDVGGASVSQIHDWVCH